MNKPGKKRLRDSCDRAYVVEWLLAQPKLHRALFELLLVVRPAPHTQRSTATGCVGHPLSRAESAQRRARHSPAEHGFSGGSGVRIELDHDAAVLQHACKARKPSDIASHRSQRDQIMKSLRGYQYQRCSLSSCRAEADPPRSPRTSQCGPVGGADSRGSALTCHSFT